MNAELCVPNYSLQHIKYSSVKCLNLRSTKDQAFPPPVFH